MHSQYSNFWMSFFLLTVQESKDSLGNFVRFIIFCPSWNLIQVSHFCHSKSDKFQTYSPRSLKLTAKLGPSLFTSLLCDYIYWWHGAWCQVNRGTWVMGKYSFVPNWKLRYLVFWEVILFQLKISLTAQVQDLWSLNLTFGLFGTNFENNGEYGLGLERIISPYPRVRECSWRGRNAGPGEISSDRDLLGFHCWINKQRGLLKHERGQTMNARGGHRYIGPSCLTCHVWRVMFWPSLMYRDCSSSLLPCHSSLDSSLK